MSIVNDLFDRALALKEGKKLDITAINSLRSAVAYLGSDIALLYQQLEDNKLKVYKAVGNILIEKDAKKVEKELKDAKETLEVRIEALQKQEDSLVNRLNKIKAQIEEQTGDIGLGEAVPKGKKKKGK